MASYLRYFACTSLACALLVVMSLDIVGCSAGSAVGAALGADTAVEVSVALPGEW